MSGVGTHGGVLGIVGMVYKNPKCFPRGLRSGTAELFILSNRGAVAVLIIGSVKARQGILRP